MNVSQIDQAVEECGEGLFHKRTTLILGLGNAADAVEILCIGYILAVYEKENGFISPFHQSVVTAGVFVGMLIGGVSFGILSDSIGRRKSLLLSLFLNGSAAVLASISWSINSLILFRVLAGIGVGGSVPALFTLSAEHLPAFCRGKYISVVASFWMLGSIFTAGLAFFMFGFRKDSDSAPGSWRLFSLFVSLPSFSCFFLTFFFIPESARFYASKGKFANAIQVINEIRAVNKLDLLVLEPMACYSSSNTFSNKDNTKQILAEPCEKDPLLDQYFSIADPVLETVDSSSQWDKFVLLFHPSQRLATITLFFSWFALSFGSYGLATWITVLFSRIGLSSPFGNAFIYAAANLPGNLISILVVDIIGRKLLLSGSMTVASLCSIFFLLAERNESSYLVVLSASAFNAFSIAGWNALDILSAEVFPTSIRTSGIGLLSAGGRIGSIIAQFTNGYLIGPPMHIVPLLSITSITMFLGGISVLFLKHDTTGKVLSHSI